jgi:hypothetical protein
MDLQSFKPFADAAKKVIPLPEFPSVSALGAAGAASMASIIAAISLGFEAILWVPAGVLLLSLLLLMTADLVTEFFGVPREDRHEYPWDREITGKFLQLVLVVMSLVLDVVIYVSASYLPQELAILSGGYLFVTYTTMIWLIAGHVAHITANVASHEGDEVVPPTIGVLARQIRWLLGSLRMIDQRRVRGADLPTPPTALSARWYDDISEDEIKDLARYIESRRGRHPPDIFPVDEGGVAK